MQALSEYCTVTAEGIFLHKEGGLAILFLILLRQHKECLQERRKQMKTELKKWTMEDKESLQKICSSADRRYLAERMPDPYTLEDAQWWLEMVREKDGKDGVFRAVVADGKIVGNISVEKKSDVYRKDAELGYVLQTEQWSRGIMTQAVSQICRIAFEELDLLRITGLVYEPNLASRRVLEKNGFCLEGIMKNAVVKGEQVYNLCVYGKLREEQI